MPNHIANRVRVTGSLADVQEIHDQLRYDPTEKDKEGYVRWPDFNKIIPMPDHIFKGDLPFIHNCGEDNWYDWGIKNWGTKWNSYENKVVQGPAEVEDGLATAEFYFETAWSNVAELIRQISVRFPFVTIEYMFSDEDIGSQCGVHVFNGGNYVSSHTPPNRSNEAFEIAFELRPDRKESYSFVNGMWEGV